MYKPWKLYDLLLDKINAKLPEFSLQSINIGLTWTLCQLQHDQGPSSGLSMSPGQYSRTLPWSGELTNLPLSTLCGWIRGWNAFESVVAQSAINAIINSDKTSLISEATPLVAQDSSMSANLTVFQHFLPLLKNKKIVVIGHYPGIERLQAELDLMVLERNPCESDLPDSACEYLIPDADWVFISASSIANKTFPRLAQLASNAVTVLMGPSVPWLTELKEFGIDFLAGVSVCDAEQLQVTVAEGGGVRIFEKSVQYRILDIGETKMHSLKDRISSLVSQRESLKTEMDLWYNQNEAKRFPKWKLLEQTDRELSLADTCYKRQWDARRP